MSEPPIYGWLNHGLCAARTGDPLAAHEAFEAVFRRTSGGPRQVAKGLAQLAAGLVKRQRGAEAGAARLQEKAARTLEGEVGRGGLGLDVVAFARSIRAGAPEWPASLGPDGVLYLHGFASSPGSAKAREVASHVRARGLSIAVPNQNEGHRGPEDFSGLTVSRILDLARRHLRDRTVVVGSSLGGYVASLLAAADPRVVGLVLLAPAFEFGARLLGRHGPAAIDEWRARGEVLVHHHAYGEPRPLSVGILDDALAYPGRPPIRVPTAIVHGRFDETVPLGLSEAAQADAPAIELTVTEDDHALLRSTGAILGALDRALARAALRADPAPIDPP